MKIKKWLLKKVFIHVKNIYSFQIQIQYI